MSPALQTILPVLVHIQAHLEDDLSLDAVAAKAGVSRHHFHRTFLEATGETLKAYTMRLRLERAAFRLLFHEGTILAAGLDSGFANHETFTRAFRRRFGMPPSVWRSMQRSRWSAARGSTDVSGASPRFELSSTRPVRLRERHLAFIRHVGPYENVSESLWHELEAWALERGWDHQLVFFGIGHDAPITTPAHLLRFDAAIQAPEPFAGDGRVAHQLLPAGDYALTTHAGHYSTLPEAYRAMFPAILALSGYRFAGLPAIEIYHTTRVLADYELNHTGIYIPIEPIARNVKNP